MSKPPLIFISTRAPWPPVTGHFMRTYRTLNALAQIREIHFLGFYDKGLGADARERVENELKKICTSVALEPVRSEQGRFQLILDLIRSSVSFKPFVARKYFSHSLYSRMGRLLKADPCTVVWADMLPLAEYLREVPPERSILTMHNVESMRLRRLSSGAGNLLVRVGLSIQATLLESYERRVLPRLQNCIAVSDEDALILREMAPACRVSVVPNGADLVDPPILWGSSDRPTALWVGGMKDPYNREAVDVFCQRALPEIIRRMPKFQWLVVGGHPSPAVLAAREKYSENVQITGFVDDLMAQYRRAHVAVIPLQSGAGTKLKVLEAMGAGIAVVTTPVGAEGLHATDGVELSICGEMSRFVGEACRLLDDAAAARTMARAAYSLVATKFQWPIVDAAIRDEVKKVSAGIDVKNRQC